jgi:hypothetical protein
MHKPRRFSSEHREPASLSTGGPENARCRPMTEWHEDTVSRMRSANWPRSRALRGLR